MFEEILTLKRVNMVNLIKSYIYPIEFSNIRRFNFFLISKDPIVIFTFVGWNLSNVQEMSAQLGNNKKIVFLVGFSRFVSYWKILHIKRQQKVIQSYYSNVELIYLANSKDELNDFKKAKLKSYFVANNCFQREDVFSIIPGAEKKYDAVMNARMAKWKRIELAECVNNIALITIKDNDEYMSEMRDLFINAYWPNFEGSNTFSYLRRVKVNKILNQSKVGLILSEIEGNNRATIEYLLCGIPVVSTISRGGRDFFIDKQSGIITKADKVEIKNAVEELKAKEIDAHEIRKRAIEKIKSHRSRFAEIVCEVTNGKKNIQVDDWLNKFSANMEFQCNKDNFLKYFNSDYFSDLPLATSEKSLKNNYPEVWSRILQ